jgi:hypothetical protein
VNRHERRVGSHVMPMVEPNPPALGLNRVVGQCCSSPINRNIVNRQRDQSQSKYEAGCRPMLV